MVARAKAIEIKQVLENNARFEEEKKLNYLKKFAEAEERKRILDI